MALTVGTDSFVSVAEAGEYLASMPDRADWEPVEQPRKEQLLRLATRLLDDLFEWCGWPEDYNQRLAFPRVGLPNRHDGPRSDWWWRPYAREGTPEEIRQATAELAYRLNSTDFTAENAVADLDLRGASGGVAFGGGAFRRAIPSAVVDMIPSQWYSSVRGTGQMRVVPFG